jgi:AbrB family looped-hinge helix DNA binding protein
VKATAKVTSKGQVTIPKEIRRALRVRVGDRLVFVADGKGVRLKVSSDESALTEQMGVFRKGKGLTASQVDRWLGELRGHEE